MSSPPVPAHNMHRPRHCTGFVDAFEVGILIQEGIIKYYFSWIAAMPLTDAAPP